MRSKNIIHNYSTEYINEIMNQAWGEDQPKNGFSLAKKYMQEHKNALKNNHTVQIPNLCLSFIFLNVSALFLI